MITTNSSNNFLQLKGRVAVAAQPAVSSGNSLASQTQSDDFTATLQQQINSDSRSINELNGTAGAPSSVPVPVDAGTSAGLVPASVPDNNTAAATLRNTALAVENNVTAETMQTITVAPTMPDDSPVPATETTVTPPMINNISDLNLTLLQMQPVGYSQLNIASSTLTNNAVPLPLAVTSSATEQALLKVGTSPTTAAELQQKLSQETGTVIHSLTVTAATGTPTAGQGVALTAADHRAGNDGAVASTITAAGTPTVFGNKNTTVANSSTSVSVPVTTANPVPETVDSSSQKDLLKTLDSDARTAAIRSSLQQNSTTTSSHSNISVSNGSQVTLSSAAAEAVKKTVSTAESSVGSGSNVATDSTLFSNANILAGQHGTTTTHGAAELVANSNNAAGQSLFANSADRVNAVEQILDMVKENLPLPAMSAASGLKLDFDAGSLGRIQMQLQQNGDAIQVTISANSDSAQQQLMDQRQELAQSLRNLGYRDLAVNINDQRQQSQGDAQSRQNQPSGNDDIDNVRLNGDSQEDLLQLLTVN